MNAETMIFLNFVVHSLVIGAAAWLLVRFIIRDAMRRCILANLAVLMCLYGPFNISMQDLFPPQQPVPVWTPIQETFKADWRVSVAPASTPMAKATPQVRVWEVNVVAKGLRGFAWLVAAVLLLRLVLQSIGVQRWVWGLRRLTREEAEFLRGRVLGCASPLELCASIETLESSRGLEHSRTLARMRVFDHEGTPCVAGWFRPLITVPASAFEKLTPHQWGWLLRHEGEHLRCNDTVAVLLQNVVRAFLWWNPFAHGLIEEYARAREEACDAAAVGAEREHTAYADFLLAWAAQSVPQSGCVMPIAHSRPARRLKVRLVALMEARGVRKKLGAFFVLACVVFAIIAPMIAASFGIATAVAEEAVKAKADDGRMYTRVYRVPPDYLTGGAVPSDPFAAGKAPTTAVIGRTARQLLEEQGIAFPEGTSAIYNPKSSHLIVRHYKGALDQIGAIIDRLNKRTPFVRFQCKLIPADIYFGTHEGILQSDEAKELWRQVSQKKGIDLATLPAVTIKLGLEAIVEVVQEVLPEKLAEKNVASVFKFVGPSIKLVANSTSNGKAMVAAKVDLGVDPDGAHSWLPQKGGKPDWDRVQIYTTSAQAELASGETLVMHLETSKKRFTVLITAEALNLTGQKAVSFESTATMLPSSTGIDVPYKAASEWGVRVYRVPLNFPKDKPPMEALQAAGIPLEKNASAVLRDGKLTVRNTKPNLELIEVVIDSLYRAMVKKSVVITVHAAEMKGDHLKLMNDWFPPVLSDQKPDVIKDPTLLSFAASPPSGFVLRMFTTAGIFSNAQYCTVIKRLSETKMMIETLRPKQKPQFYDLPTPWGGHEMKVESTIGPDGNTIDLIVHTPSPDDNLASGISTGVTIWDGQTVVLAAQPSEGVSRVLFITAHIVEAEKKK
jgi:beta-lactamase regulating signal transducer with metallopeptidase domain